MLISGCRRGISHILFPLDFVTFVQISEPAHSPRELLPRKFRRHLRLHRSPRIEREPRTVLPQSLLRAMLAALDMLLRQIFAQTQFPASDPINGRRLPIVPEHVFAHVSRSDFGKLDRQPKDGSDTGGGE